MKEKSMYHIHPSGGLLSIQFLEKLREHTTSEKYLHANTFSIGVEVPPAPSELESKISESWNSLLERWYGISLTIDQMDISTARRKWIIPFLQGLGFNPVYLKKDTLVSDEKEAKIFLSHRGGEWQYAPIIHTVAPTQDLDTRTENGRGSKSPHDALQIFLNENKNELWGIITNGKVLRIVREYYHTYTKGYIEFDLEGIFEERSFSDFLALYRLVHPSRFIPDEDGMIPLEHFYKTSLAAGEKIGDDLRQNVKMAIEVLGNGFLTNELIEKMIRDPEECNLYYQEILNIIYRIIFLMFAEQRGMLPTRDSLYAEMYSITKLRERAEKAKRRDRHYDIWKGLLVTFEMIRKGVDNPKIGIFGYDGSLFDDRKIKHVKYCNCENTNILQAIKYLTYFETEKVLQRISYIDLGVEEIGSIYESLLDFESRILEEDMSIDSITYPKYTFFLDPRGAARRSTGSYYTDPIIVNDLIVHALKPIIKEKLKNLSSKKEKEASLLSIKICDPALGSAAFVIAATNYLGLELAKIRTETEYPSEKEERKARREVLQHCIYGVDLNPMAVELAKVSLWINACAKQMPLNFLDHHIKCGNSLIGTDSILINKGIPDEAYTPLDGDEKGLSKYFRDINQKQRKMSTLYESFEINYGKKFLKDYEELSKIEEIDILDVKKKKEKYNQIINSYDWNINKLIHDVWTSSFFWNIKENTSNPPTTSSLRILKNTNNSNNIDDVIKNIQEISNQKRFFHWSLEFPDVFYDGGFDVVLSNPPFLGGWKIRGIHGDKFNNFLSYRFQPSKGRSDLCAHFYRLAFSILKENGIMGMVATNTIGQGATRESGLGPILNEGGSINFTKRFVKWPGSANVEVNLLSIKKGSWDDHKILDDKNVKFISSRLDEFPEKEDKIIENNKNKSFAGDALRGMGFVVDESEAIELINKNEKNSNCLYKFLNGEDLNNKVNQESEKYVICFHDWNLNEAKQFPDILKIVEERVKPERDKVREKRERENWWLFARFRGELRNAISNIERVIIRAATSELHMLTFSPKNWIYSHAIVVFAFDDFYHFSILQSNIHETWVRRNASTLRTDIRYTPTTCFETFPFPNQNENINSTLVQNIGLKYLKHRTKVMQNRKIGLTKTYNLFHDSNNKDEDIVILRKLHKEMDLEVLSCYNWKDIDLNHGFYINERKKNRYTISPSATRKLLERLIEFNNSLINKG